MPPPSSIPDALINANAPAADLVPSPFSGVGALYQARANLCAQIAEVTAKMSPTYSTDGESVDWGSYLGQLNDALAQVNKAIASVAMSGPVELVSVAVAP